MDGPSRLTVRISNDEEESDDLLDLTVGLRSELQDLDILGVELYTPTETPDGAKGLGAALGWLVVHLGRDPLRTVIAAVIDWALRHDRSVEIILDGDTLKLGRATREQQEQVVNAWLARHASSAGPA